MYSAAPLKDIRLHCFVQANKTDPEGGFKSTPQVVDQCADCVKDNMYSLNTAYIPDLADLCPPLYLITEQLREYYDEHAVDTWLPEEDMDSIYDMLREATEWIHASTGGRLKKEAPVDYIEFKKISDSFKGSVGTKVTNK